MRRIIFTFLFIDENGSVSIRIVLFSRVYTSNDIIEPSNNHDDRDVQYGMYRGHGGHGRVRRPP